MSFYYSQPEASVQPAEEPTLPELPEYSVLPGLISKPTLPELLHHILPKQPVLPELIPQPPIQLPEQPLSQSQPIQLSDPVSPAIFQLPEHIQPEHSVLPGLISEPTFPKLPTHILPEQVMPEQSVLSELSEHILPEQPVLPELISEPPVQLPEQSLPQLYSIQLSDPVSELLCSFPNSQSNSSPLKLFTSFKTFGSHTPTV